MKEKRTKEWEKESIETIRRAIEGDEKFIFSSETASIGNGSMTEMVSLIVCIIQHIVRMGFPKDVLIETMEECIKEEEDVCLGERND